MEELFVIWAMTIATGTGVWLLRIISRSLERRHERSVRGGAVDTALAERVEELERQLDGAGFVSERLGELEERQDFAERMLAQHTREQLPGERH